MAVNEADAEAHTSYRVLESLRGATLAEALLHTGRTHQIRVHFQFLGYPVVGDLTYGDRQNQKLEASLATGAKRQMLHAYHLGFTHPRTGKKVALTPHSPRILKTL